MIYSRKFTTMLSLLFPEPFLHFHHWTINSWQTKQPKTKNGSWGAKSQDPTCDGIVQRWKTGGHVAA